MNLINKKDGYSLYGSMNTWDMNYHLVDDKGNDYLIDTADVVDSYEELDEYGVIVWEELKALDDIDFIKDCAWKVDKVNGNLGLRNALDKITIL